MFKPLERVKILTLKELEIGDLFYNTKDLNRKIFTVRGNPAFNIRHGSPVRICADKKGDFVSKSCKISVVKTGESKFKEQYKQKPINKI